MNNIVVVFHSNKKFYLSFDNDYKLSEDLNKAYVYDSYRNAKRASVKYMNNYSCSRFDKLIVTTLEQEKLNK